MKKSIFCLAALVLVVISCSKSDDPIVVIDTFHEEYYDVNIKPALNNFKSEIEKQIEATIMFQESTTETNFNNLQTQWLNTAKAFSKTRVYNLAAVKTQFFDVHIYNFPTYSIGIEDNIAEKSTYNTVYLASKSTVEKGLGALEYLLYNNQDSVEALLLLQNDTFRGDYLLAVSHEILRQSNLLIAFWEEGYKDEFINARSVSCIENARCLSFNQLINILDVIRVTKIGKPSGLENSTSASLESLEAYRSGSSLKLIRSSVEEVEHAYSLSSVNFSNIVNNITGTSELSDEINTAFSEVYKHIDAIDGSLYEAIKSDNPHVELLYNSLLILVKYFSVDAASTLSVNVLPTDNDSD